MKIVNNGLVLNPSTFQENRPLNNRGEYYLMVNAIYARVSDDKLKDDGERRQDVNRQIERLRAYAGQDALIFIDDGISAFKEDFNARESFMKMLREIKANRVHKVYVETLDRISRRVADGLPLLETISKNNCTVISIAEGEIDVTSSPGWLRTGIFLLMAEWSSRDKSDKVKSAMERMRNDKRRICQSCGVVHLGRHPLNCSCSKCKRKGGVSKSLQKTEETKEAVKG